MVLKHTHTHMHDQTIFFLKYSLTSCYYVDLMDTTGIRVPHVHSLNRSIPDIHPA